ncbi:cell division protein FtsX [Aestuariibius sp. 2305UL40-4]|uniref:cell division protein FtsX n=1 Tax=Aestuariibius violaceus TaxID=3234132 RepID=UPI00345E3BF8
MSSFAGYIQQLIEVVRGDPDADRVVPKSGQTARLTILSAAAMSFLSVFVLAFALSAGRLATLWQVELAQGSTLRIVAPEEDLSELTERALEILGEIPGIASARALSDEEQKALLAPWFGEELPLDILPTPRLIAVTPRRQGFDAAGLAAQLARDLPEARLDDHSTWRAPLVRAASALRGLGWAALGLIAVTMGAVVTLAAQASLGANAQVIGVLRLVGARDAYITRAFVRRFTLRALSGAAVGMALAIAVFLILPTNDDAPGGVLTRLSLGPAGWFLAPLVPVFAALLSFFATRAAAMTSLRKQT